MIVDLHRLRPRDVVVRLQLRVLAGPTRRGQLQRVLTVVCPDSDRMDARQQVQVRKGRADPSPAAVARPRGVPSDPTQDRLSMTGAGRHGGPQLWAHP